MALSHEIHTNTAIMGDRVASRVLKVTSRNAEKEGILYSGMLDRGNTVILKEEADYERQ